MRPLSRPALRRLVDEAFWPYCCLFGLQGWRLSVRFASLSTSASPSVGPLGLLTGMRVSIDLGYRRAVIQIDPRRYYGRREFLRSFRHEFLHLVLAPLCLAQSAATEAVDFPPPVLRLYRFVEAYADEASVSRLESVFDLAGLSPERCLVLGRRVARGNRSPWLARSRGGRRA